MSEYKNAPFASTAPSALDLLITAPFTCPSCDKEFLSHAALLSHLDWRHPNFYTINTGAQL